MIELRAVDYRDDDNDSCYNTAHAALELNGVKVLLCKKCLSELIETVNEFNNTTFCHQCGYFLPSEWGFDHTGSCFIDGDDHMVDRDSMDTCNRPDRDKIRSYYNE